MSRISTIQLRTTDVDGARAFYAAVLGRDDLPIALLPAQAIARGARPHWLGSIDVPALDAALAGFVARGAEQLGPRLTVQGVETAVVRDPGGAVVALTQPSSGARAPGLEVVWHQLNTAELSRAKHAYGELFGWHFEAPQALPSVGLVNHPFAWSAGEEAAGAMSHISARPGVHPHWLFHFRVPALAAALEAARAHGGSFLAPFELPSGARVAVCDDAQGAAFALIETPR